MKLDELLNSLFPAGHSVKVEDWLVRGSATVDGKPVAVLGTTQSVMIGIRECITLGEALMDVIRSSPCQPVIMLVDNSGQRMSLQEELLVLPEYIAFLLECQQLARQAGHALIAVVYGNSIAGGFIAFGMGADRIYAVEGAETSVMKLEAIARVTKMPLADLEALAQKVSVFAPGPENFAKMGGLHAIWTGNYAMELSKALAECNTDDTRAQLGLDRGGRMHAKSVMDRIAGA